MRTIKSYLGLRRNKEFEAREENLRGTLSISQQPNRSREKILAQSASLIVSVDSGHCGGFVPSFLPPSHPP